MFHARRRYAIPCTYIPGRRFAVCVICSNCSFYKVSQFDFAVCHERRLQILIFANDRSIDTLSNASMSMSARRSGTSPRAAECAFCVDLMNFDSWNVRRSGTSPQAHNTYNFDFVSKNSTGHLPAACYFHIRLASTHCVFDQFYSMYFWHCATPLVIANFRCSGLCIPLPPRTNLHVCAGSSLLFYTLLDHQFVNSLLFKKLLIFVSLKYILVHFHRYGAVSTITTISFRCE